MELPEARSLQLPAGRMVSSAQGEPVLWLSDAPVSSGLWSRVLAEHPRFGLWPLLLDGRHHEPDRPWESQELTVSGFSRLTEHDPEELFTTWWNEHAHVKDGVAPPESLETAPFGLWPGRAPAHGVQRGAAEQRACEYAELLVEYRHGCRLGLVRARSGAEAMTESGWTGPLNYDNDTAVFACVVADWERRFGARVLGLGFDTLTLSVAAPPTDIDQALRVAAEHFAFCPDNILQNPPHRLRAYAEALIERPLWNFWWD
ncbi:DUF4253 domain-containing protein [Nocardiopsis sp. NPDC006832]|uniref:DUF4253 domain-containing protein n=1 Tax=Nocardiopsis sp. NPDC006832 TaxID=3157188 RepID=UPI0033E33520